MLGLIPTDLDLATDAPPQLVKEIIETTPELAFAKGPKNAHKFGSFKVVMLCYFRGIVYFSPLPPPLANFILEILLDVLECNHNSDGSDCLFTICLQTYVFKFVQEHFLFIHLNNCVHEWLTHVAKPTIINPLPRALSQSPTRCSSLPPPLPTYALPSLFPHINLPLSPYSISITGFPSRFLLLDNDGLLV